MRVSPNGAPILQGRGLQSVQEAIRSAFEVARDDIIIDIANADGKTTIAEGTIAESMITAGVQLIDIDEEVDVEWVQLETDVDAETCLRDAVEAHQHTSADEQSSVYYIEPPVESAQTLIEAALRLLQE